MTADEPTKEDINRAAVRAVVRRYLPLDVRRALEVRRHREAMRKLDEEARRGR